MNKQKKARWIQKTHLFRADEYICSACQFKTVKPASQCPSCGSVMRGKKYDPNWVDEMEIFDILMGD